MSIILLNINIFLFIIFFIPSIFKMKDIDSFTRLFKLLSFKYPEVLSKLIIIAELISSIMILYSKTQKYGLIIMGLLSISFIVAVLRSKDLSVSVSCNCLGSLSSGKLDNTIIYRSLFFLMSIIFALLNSSIETFSFQIDEIIYAILHTLSVIAGYLIITNIVKYQKMYKEISNR